jgi:hypothetical protein
MLLHEPELTYVYHQLSYVIAPYTIITGGLNKCTIERLFHSAAVLKKLVMDSVICLP